MKLTFIGGGAMAESIINGVLSASLATPEEISVGEPLESRCQYLTNQYQICATPQNLAVINQGELVILATQPQNLPEVAAEIGSHLIPDQTVVSIIAGIQISGLITSLSHQSIIRVMPNTPAQIGAGISLWICSPEIAAGAISDTQSILKTLGDEIRVYDEKYMDMATALSASGPAYVFMFIESLIHAGVYLGLPRSLAERLTLQTVLGLSLRHI